MTTGRTCAIAAALVAACGLATAQPVGTAFTYQGRLTDAGNPASGAYDLQLALFDAVSGGAQVGATLTRDDVAVASGLFTVSLDFGAVFGGARRWLEIRVRPGASTGAYTTLTGRQELAPSPHATFSQATPWTGIAGKPAGFADDVDNDSGGDVTGVTAGAGLTGGGTTGDVALAANLAGSGSATTIARSDHNHLFQAWTGSLAGFPGLRLINTATSPFSDGVWGQTDALGQGRGVAGFATGTTGTNYGVLGQASSSAGSGVFGRATASVGTTSGVTGQNDSTQNGSAGVSGVGYWGVSGESTAPAGLGVRGVGFYGVYGSGSSYGVGGVIIDQNGVAAIEGRSLSPAGFGIGVYGRTFSPAGHAGYFEGRAHVTGLLSKGGGAFKIDHPLDPENKYLYHSFVESPDMMNVYNGNVTTDADGEATVALPDWFEALNRDFRYQLTVIGQFAQAIVAREVEGNSFAIRTSLPHVKVSWQVTGIRQDAFAEKHRLPVEEDKPERERGKYMHPVEHGQPQEKGVGWERFERHHEGTRPPDPPR